MFVKFYSIAVLAALTQAIKDSSRVTESSPSIEDHAFDILAMTDSESMQPEGVFGNIGDQGIMQVDPCITFS